jgi:hypothetical protein
LTQINQPGARLRRQSLPRRGPAHQGEVTVAAIPALMAGDATGSDRKAAMPRERTSNIVFNIALACLWLGLMVAGFAAISHGARNLLTLYVVVAATALTLFVRWMWQRRPG